MSILQMIQLPSSPHQPLEFTYQKHSFGGSTEEHNHLSVARSGLSYPKYQLLSCSSVDPNSLYSSVIIYQPMYPAKHRCLRGSATGIALCFCNKQFLHNEYYASSIVPRMAREVIYLRASNFQNIPGGVVVVRGCVYVVCMHVTIYMVGSMYDQVCTVCVL